MLESLIAGALGGALGGKAADTSAKIPSPGGLGSLISGGLGGLAGGGLLNSVLSSGVAGGFDWAQAAGSLVGGGVLGTIVTAVVGLALKSKKS
ncbi:hypothetical protein [Mycolicibacter longobardus]|uniref:DNA methyltransferase n=1 Tax=Mycolicibacter longobardus TaxID=1108812 RepID=A0A1X1YP36_9MYCO|nr:hypothetical protein [Mycolicibacter longobardus]MCV7384304.1 hypothetical protein [Mycolicibacter longobardus]ORW12795.1 hypothetical protein AWC16_06460 [Mycolicibacter longobardus]